MSTLKQAATAKLDAANQAKDDQWQAAKDSSNLYLAQLQANQAKALLQLQNNSSALDAKMSQAVAQEATTVGNAQSILSYQNGLLEAGKASMLVENQTQVTSAAKQANFDIQQHDAKWQSAATGQFESALQAAALGMAHDVLSTIQMAALAGSEAFPPLLLVSATAGLGNAAL